jgi:type I restriction enzyme, R subunit
MHPGGSMQYEPIAISSESTVVAEYESKVRDSTAYQSEAQLEAAFIKLLKEQAYEYLTFDSEKDLLNASFVKAFQANETELSRKRPESKKIRSASLFVTTEIPRTSNSWIRTTYTATNSR